MYIHLGGDVIIKEKDVIGIFNLETSSTSKITREYLKAVQKKGYVENIGYEIPASFIVCSTNDENKVYTTQISSKTLAERTNFINKMAKNNHSDII